MARAWRRTTRRWRRSLRTRVVTTTLVLCLAVVALLGTFLLGRVRDGLLENKTAASLAEAAAGARSAQQQFDAGELTDEVSRGQLAYDVVRKLAAASGASRDNEILLLGDQGVSVADAADVADTDSAESKVPIELREEVQKGPAGQRWTYVALPRGEGAMVPGLAVGEQLLVPPSARYELYYLFPLSEELATLQLVQRALALAGGALVLLVGLIAWLVTRQVVRPVRMAARIAERLSAGDLEQRMHLRGEDDLARLSASFNRMAASLQRQIGQLEDLSRVQRRFVSDVSHELRTPVTTVRMAADVLHEARASFDPAVARSAELLQAQLDRFEALLADLLEISRYDAGVASLETDPVDLRHLAAGVIAGVEPLAARKGSSVSLHTPRTPCVAEADYRRIERVLRNLIVNAIEHGEGRPIQVRVAVDSQAVAVAVRDHGVGLHPSEAALVFDRFWRADPARARTTGGTGLGLSIALEDAHLHGGWLQAWGSPGNGAQFRLTLPRRAGHELRSSPIPLVPQDASDRAGQRIGPVSPARTPAGRAGG